MAKSSIVTGISNAGFETDTDVLTPPALAAGETVLLTPAARSRILVIDAAGMWFLDSLAAGEVGDVVTIVNGSPFTGTLGHAEGAAYGGAADLNCFNCPDGLPYVLRSGARVEVQYGPFNEAGVNRWNVIGVNFFAPNGRLCPATYTEFQERTAFLPTQLWPCDDMGLGSAQPLREASNQNLTVSAAPLVDWRMNGYRGVQVTEGGNGWRLDVADPADGSVLIGTFFGSDTLIADNLLAGRVADAAARRAYNGVASATQQFTGYFHDGAVFILPTVVKVVTDEIVRLGISWLNRVTDIANARVSGRGEAPVASADVAAGALGTLSGGANPRNFVGATALTGSVVVTFIGGAFQIYGAGAEVARAPAKIAHRLGMEQA